MSIKDLFRTEKTQQSVKIQSQEELERQIESSEYFDLTIQDNKRMIPQVDFSKPENFAFFGLASQYYSDGFKYISEQYPYDGSLKEKKAWHLSATYLDLYLFDKKYPKTNGYINLGINYGSSNGTPENDYQSFGSDEYISFRGGPHTSSNGMIGKPLHEVFSGSNLIEELNNRGNNLNYNLNNGMGIEFWLRKPNYVSGSESARQVICDIWNGASVGSTNYGRFRVEIKPGVTGETNEFQVYATSGTVENTINLTSSLQIDDNNWHQYSIFLRNSGSNIVSELFVSGNLQDTETTAVSLNPITGAMRGYIGSLITEASSSIAAAGWGKLSGSLDEFRFWKTRRNSEQIGRNWFTQVGGGTNTDTSNTDLGIYYKFNEGIINNDVIDSIVLDYSGRISNGSWTGYVSGSRNTGSALLESNATQKEFLDPIIYWDHPLVQTSLNTLLEEGDFHDVNNNSLLYNSIPQWIIDEDEKDRKFTLRKFLQSLASVLDSLYLQTQEISKLKNISYPTGSSKPYPFASKFINNLGIETPEIFNKVDILEKLMNRDDFINYENNVNDIKNTIYQNIYNNLVPILKSKGTEQSFRNLIHCFGIGDELIKLNTYSNNTDFVLENDFRLASIQKNFVNFNDPDRFDSTVHQWTGSDGLGNSYFDLSNTFPLAGASFQCETIVPRKFDIDSELYFYTSFVTSSIFGAHSASTTQTDLTWNSTDDTHFRVLLIKPEIESKDGYFMLTGSSNIPVLTSSLISNIYDETNWNLFVNFKPLFPSNSQSSGSVANQYNIEFIGVHKTLDITENYFKLTGTVSSLTYGLQRLFCGAHRTNFTGSIVENCDLKISNVRVFAKSLSDNEIEFHSRDTSNFGSEFVSENFLLDVDNNNLNINSFNSRVLDWDFSQVTSSGDSSDSLPTTSDATFDIFDISSGSQGNNLPVGVYQTALDSNHPARGAFFLPFDENAIKKEFVHAAKQIPFESKISSNSINIRAQDDEIFTRESRPVTNFFVFEKSYNQILSEEILNYFASIRDFNNLIGDPINRYRPDYKVLGQIRRMFFDKNGEKASFEKFVDFYQWVDNSVNDIINQLVPASAEVSKKVRNVVENHILQRNKYFNKFPTLEFDIQEPEAALRGINELLYSAKSGTAPAGLSQNINDLWWSKRANRDESPLASSDSILNSSLQRIFQPINSTLIREFGVPLRLSAQNNITGAVGISLLNIKNVKNINSVTSSNVIPRSSSLGNYNKDYEIINTSGRTGMSRTFIKNNGFTSILNISNFLTGVEGNLSQSVIDRSSGNNDWIIVERFSSPGSKESMGEKGLDSAAKEFSPYNTINYRNLNIRKDLNASQKRVQNLNSVSASLYKIETNTSDILEFSGGVIVTGTSRDNWFVNRTIPSRDLNYSWIKKSAKNSLQPYGYRNTNFTIITGALNQSKDKFDFISASEIDSRNANIFSNRWGVIDIDTNTIPISSSSSDTLNDVLISNYSSYGDSSWKSIRKNNPIAHYLRRNNIFSIENNITQKVFTGSSGKTYTSYASTGTFQNFVEPVVSQNFKPIIHTLIDKETNKPIQIQYSFSNDIQGFANKDLNKILNVKTCKTTLYDKIIEFYKDTTLNPENNVVKGVSSIVFGQTIWPKNNNNGLKKSRKRENFKEVVEYELLTNQTSDPGFSYIPEEFAYSVISSSQENNISRQNRETFWKNNIIERTFQSQAVESGFNEIGIAFIADTFTLGTTLINSQGYKDGRALSIWPLPTSINFSSSFLGLADPRPINTFRNDDTAELSKNFFSIASESSGFSFFSLYEKFFGFRESGYGQSTPQRLADNKTYYYPTASLSYYYNNDTSFTSSIDNTGLTLPQITNIKPRYRAHIFAGKNPWYDSYEDYVSDIKFSSKNMTLIPEFNISEHIKYYVDEKGGDFRAKNNKFLTLKGAAIDASANSPSSSLNSEFFKNYVYSDNIFNFNKVSNDHKGLLKPNKISLTCKGIKKLLPYNGFYPQTRTLQIGTLLSESVGPYISGMGWITGAGDPLLDPHSCSFSGALALQSLLQPLMAPGILYNSIKSGIAVDWPIFTGSSYANDLDNNRPVITTSPNYRLPFETIIDLKTANGNGGIPIVSSSISRSSSDEIPEGSVFLIGPESKVNGNISTGSLRNPYFYWNGNKKIYYELAMNNFVASTVDFFLENSKLKSFVSRPEKQILGKFESGKTYYMDVVLRKSSNMVMMEHSASIRNPLSASNSNISFDGSLFGPTLEVTGGFASTPRFWASPADPGQSAYTPPYFYGDSVARLSYTADGTETINGTISKVLSSLQVENINRGLFDSVFYYNFDSVVQDYSEAFSGTIQSLAWINRMNVGSSVDLQGILRTNKLTYNLNKNIKNNFNAQIAEEPENSSNDRWVIGTKWETPVLNFNSQPIEDATVFVSVEEGSGEVITGTIDFSTGRGMWSGYGQIPTGNEGIFLEIRESFPTITNNSLTGSLINIFGFNNTSEKVGEIAKTKQISEAIIAIPFVDEEIISVSQKATTVKVFGHNLFKLTRNKFDEQRENIQNTSISDLASRIDNYILPPQLDFITYDDIPSFVMYLFEFKHTLDQQDLSDIWQGLMPKIALNMEQDQINISHDFGENEFFEGKDLPENIRWMIFKVKRKSSQNYFEKTINNQDDSRFKFDFEIGSKTPEYSYNWPYDYFSLVETANIDVEIEMEPISGTNESNSVFTVKRDVLNNLTKN